MESNRESTVSIKSLGFKDSDVKFNAQVRYDFGTDQCAQKEKLIKDHGITPGNNVFLFTHEFENEGAASSACTKIESFKDAPVPFAPLLKYMEGLKAEGKKLSFGLRMEPSFGKEMEILHEVSSYLGDLAHVNQYVTLNLQMSKTIKEILTDTTCSPLSQALGAFSFLARLSARKELPIKICDFIATKVPYPDEAERFKLIGRGISSFHHLNFEVDVREPTEKMKGLFKKRIFGGMGMFFGMMHEMAEQLGILDIVKEGGHTTKMYFCVTPFISIEASIFAPTAYEAFAQIAANPPTDV